MPAPKLNLFSFSGNINLLGTVQPSYSHNPMVPVWLDRAIEKAVKCDPKLRYDTLSEFIQDISKPNRLFLEYTPLPLMKRNPVFFGKVLR